MQDTAVLCLQYTLTNDTIKPKAKQYCEREQWAVYYKFTET